MNKLLYFLFMLFIVSTQIYAQPNRGKNPRNMDKIAQLEKIKLMEILELDEETSIKFFMRFKEHREKMRENMDKIDLLIDDMRTKIEDGVIDKNEILYKKLNEEFISLDNSGKKIRTDFIQSLTDLLTPIQITKLLIFERTFRNEMQDLLIKQKGGRRMR